MANRRKATKPWRGSMNRRLAADAGLSAMVEQELRAMEITQELVRIRERQKLTQQEIADKMGVSQPLVARLERGEAPNIKLGTLIRYAAAADTSVTVSFEPMKRARKRTAAKAALTA